MSTTLATAATLAAPAAPGAASASATAELESQLNTLHDQVRQLQTDNETLQSKLKEALAVQPAAVSPGQFARVQQQLRFLMKENELLKVSLMQGHGNAAEGVDAKTFELLKSALAEANEKLAVQTARADGLTLENQALQTRLQSLLASADAAEALRQENELLKKQVASFKAAPVVAMETGNPDAELTAARTQIATLQSAAEVNWLEKMALENRVKQLQRVTVGSAPVTAGPGQAENEARVSVNWSRNAMNCWRGWVTRTKNCTGAKARTRRRKLTRWRSRWTPCARGWRWMRRRRFRTRRRNWLCSSNRPPN